MERSKWLAWGQKGNGKMLSESKVYNQKLKGERSTNLMTQFGPVGERSLCMTEEFKMRRGKRQAKAPSTNSMPVSSCEKPKKHAPTGNLNANNVCVCPIDNT